MMKLVPIDYTVMEKYDSCQVEESFQQTCTHISAMCTFARMRPFDRVELYNTVDNELSALRQEADRLKTENYTVCMLMIDVKNENGDLREANIKLKNEIDKITMEKQKVRFLYFCCQAAWKTLFLYFGITEFLAYYSWRTAWGWNEVNLSACETSCNTAWAFTKWWKWKKKSTSWGWSSHRRTARTRWAKQRTVLQHRRNHGVPGRNTPQIFSISSHFVLWEVLSQTNYCCSPKIKHFSTPKKF